MNENLSYMSVAILVASFLVLVVASCFVVPMYRKVYSSGWNGLVGIEFKNGEKVLLRSGGKDDRKIEYAYDGIRSHDRKEYYTLPMSPIVAFHLYGATDGRSPEMSIQLDRGKNGNYRFQFVDYKKLVRGFAGSGFNPELYVPCETMMPEDLCEIVIWDLFSGKKLSICFESDIGDKKGEKFWQSERSHYDESLQRYKLRIDRDRQLR